MGIMKHFGRAGMLASAALAMAPYAHADVTISSGATANMSCTGGVCSPTASDAVLNVNDLEGYLASGNVEVTTSGSGVQANNIEITAPFSWSSSSVLTLDAYQSITVDAAVSVAGQSGLTLTTDDGGTDGVLSFGSGGNVTFTNLSSSLMINGEAYTLVRSVQGLAAAVAANPAGEYALANSYDAKADGTYSSSPIPTEFFGMFMGLGNHISHLRLKTASSVAALFEYVGAGASLSEIGLNEVSISSQNDAAALVAYNAGTIAHVHVTGRVVGRHGYVVGGLVANNDGTIADSWSSVAAEVRGKGGVAGGLAGTNNTTGKILNSFATGVVRIAAYGLGGGAVGQNYNSIQNSYATGAVQGSIHTEVGGFVGSNLAPIVASYSTGVVGGEGGAAVGGFIGYNVGSASAKNSYWDTTSSGTSTGIGEGSSTDVTGLTTEQFQSGLPHGFHRSIWRERSIAQQRPALSHRQSATQVISDVFPSLCDCYIRCQLYRERCQT